MSTNPAKNKIVLTFDDFSVIKDKLENLRSQVYKTDFKFEDYLDKNFTKEQKEFISNDVNVTADAAASEKSIDTFLKNISNAETIFVKVPFVPSAGFIQWIKEYLQEKTANNNDTCLLMKIDTDKSLISGAHIEFRGKIKDQTAKNEVLNIFKVS